MAPCHRCMADGRCFDHVKTGWGADLVDEARHEFEEQAEGYDRWHLEEYLKDSDIRKFRLVPTLPKEICRIPAASTLPSGRYLVQVIRVADVTQPSKFQEEFEGGKYRLLSLDLTDGDQKFKAIEYTTVKDLTVKMPPGTKLLLSSSDQKPLHVQNGHLLLEPSVVTVLGGNVEKLVDSWRASREVEEKRLLWRTEGIRKKADGEGAPRWVDYDPKLARGFSSSDARKALEQDKASWRTDTGGTADPVQSSHDREREAPRFQVSEFAAEGEASTQAVKSQVASNAFTVSSSGKGGWSKGGKDGKGGDRGGKGKEKGGGDRRGGRSNDWEGEEKRAPQVVNTLAAFIKPTKKGELPDEAVASLLDTATAEPAGVAADGWVDGSWADNSWDAGGWSGGGWGDNKSWSSGGGGGKGKGGGRKGGGKGGNKSGGNRKGGGGKRR